MLTPVELAKLLKIHPHTVYRWIWKGKIKAVKVGRLVRIPCEEYKRLIEYGHNTDTQQ